MSNFCIQPYSDFRRGFSILYGVMCIKMATADQPASGAWDLGWRSRRAQLGWKTLDVRCAAHPRARSCGARQHHVTRDKDRCE